MNELIFFHSAFFLGLGTSGAQAKAVHCFGEAFCLAILRKTHA